MLVFAIVARLTNALPVSEYNKTLGTILPIVAAAARPT